MKYIVGLLALAVCAFAFPPRAETETYTQRFIEKQADILQLFKYINNPAYVKEYQLISEKFNIEHNIEKYTPEAYHQFVHWLQHGFLPRGEIFSIFNDVHRQQAEALFKILFYAKDYETFYNTAVWARQNMNEGLFLYTFSVVLVHRPETLGIPLPPIFEIYPHYFFDSATMQQAYEYKMTYHGDKTDNSHHYTIYSNYSDHHMNLHPEQSGLMSYYVEDVGINAFYYYTSIFYPFWLSEEVFPFPNAKRGEFFYHLHQQLLARFYLERLSHKNGAIKSFDWDLPFEIGYTPMLTYPNGRSFPERPNFADLHEIIAKYGQSWSMSHEAYGYTHVNRFETRIRDAIDGRFILTHDGETIDLDTPEGFNILANMIEGNADSPNARFFGNYSILARRVLGYAKQPLDHEHVVPSSLEHFETSLRDPAFYVLFKKVVLLLQNYKMNLPAYTTEDLHFEGVQVQKVEVSPLVTFFDHHYSDITNGLFVTPEEFETDPFRVQVHQYRLNHKDFEYNIQVLSDKKTKASVRIFIGPKYDEFGRVIDINENRLNFVLLDKFDYDLKSGVNFIHRNSRESPFFSRDSTTYFELYQKVLGVQETSDLHMEQTYGYPQRFMLPRGTEEGMIYQLYVIVHPILESKHEKLTTVAMTYDKLYPTLDDGYAHGYPFDRKIERGSFVVPNAYFRDVKIYHHPREMMVFDSELGVEMNQHGHVNTDDLLPLRKYFDQMLRKHNQVYDHTKMGDFHKKYNTFDVMRDHQIQKPYMTDYTRYYEDMLNKNENFDDYHTTNYDYVDLMTKHQGNMNVLKQNEMVPQNYHAYYYMTPKVSYMDHFKTMPDSLQYGKYFNALKYHDIHHEQ